MPYRTPARAARHDEVINASTFIGLVASIATPEEAADFVQSVRDEFPTATHHCWAFRVGDAMRFSDDGEPAGSAGRPMLEVVLKRDLDRCVVVVVRFYGGRKLGVGGLVRAYSGSVAKALDKAGETTVVETVELEVRAAFSDTDTVIRTLQGLAEQVETSFDEHGLVASLIVPSSSWRDIERQLQELTRGAATLTVKAE